MVDVSFEDGGGKTAENIKDEQDGKAGVRKVESQGDISADYKNEDQKQDFRAILKGCITLSNKQYYTITPDKRRS